jgi:hypothetical protein
MRTLLIILVLSGCFSGPTHNDYVRSNLGRLQADCNAGVSEACQDVQGYD